jgi:pimeloyl-ACP methyl ester carboxylesterase
MTPSRFISATTTPTLSREVDPAPSGPLGRITVAAVLTGVAAAAAAVFGIFALAPEAVVTGGALLGFALGWVLLGWATTRFTSRPQRWAYVPAALLGTAGLALLALQPHEEALEDLTWIWAPGFIALALFIVWKARRGIRGLRALPVYLVAAAVLIAGLGGLFQAAAGDPRAAAGPMPGRLVDVGGYCLHLNCVGTGGPTVVLLNGLGETSPQWARVTAAVARSTRVCAYDRAGQGWSDDSSNPGDATHAANDLHRLLAAAGEPGPYVLVGHSLGGIHALTYAHLYRNEVAGMVLLDSSSPYQAEVVKSFNGEYRFYRRALAATPTLARLGVGRVMDMLGEPALPGRPGRQASAFTNSPRGWVNQRAEQAALPTAFAQARALTTLGDLPLVVLTSATSVEQTPEWKTAQDQLATLSTDTRHTVVDVGHMDFLLAAQGAAASVAAVDEVITAVRTRRG